MCIGKPKAVVFATGSKKKGSGGSGLLHLIFNMLTGLLPIEIIAVVSNHPDGSVKEIADRYGLRFFPMTSFTAEDYQHIATETGAEWFLLSGWLKFVRGLPSNRTVNIHPGLTKGFGGPRMYGHHVHEAVITSGIEASAVTMHFVTEQGYDWGPTFFEYPVSTSGCNEFGDKAADELSARVNRYEHGHQSWITWMVISGQISWSGREEDEVRVPLWYRTMPFCPARLRVLPWWYRLLRCLIGASYAI